MSQFSPLDQLVAACHWIGAKSWAPATGGNISVREDGRFCLLSESVKDKGSLTRDDFIQVEIATNSVPSGRKPSAETGLHTHTVNATVLSRVEKSSALRLEGYDMQKSLAGQRSHLDGVAIPVFDND